MLVLCSSMQSVISLPNSFTLHYMLLVVSRRNNMMLKLRNTILMSMMMLVYKCNSQTFLPLSPCYSVHKIPADHNSVHYYRFVGNLVLQSEDSGMGCMFTMEGPPGSKLQLQLFDVVLQKPGYVSTSLGDDNCSLGLVQIYNLTSNGALVQAQKVCGSFMAGPLISSDTNVAVVTTNAAQGQFDLHVTIQQQKIKSIFQENSNQDGDKTRLIILGYQDLNKLTQKQAPQLSEKHLEDNIKNLSSLASGKENQMTKATEETEETNKDDDSVNYTEYDYEYEPDQHALLEVLSESEEKIPLEKLFNLRENSKYEKNNNFKTTNKKQKQFVHRTKHHSETISSSALKSPKNATKTKGINQSNNNKFRSL